MVLKLWGRALSDISVTKWAADVDSPVDEKEPREPSSSSIYVEPSTIDVELGVARTLSRSTRVTFARPTMRTRWEAFVRSITTADPPTRVPTNSYVEDIISVQFEARAEKTENDGPVDEVVVDADWDAPITPSSHSMYGPPEKQAGSLLSSPDLDLYTELPERSFLSNAARKVAWDVSKFFSPNFHKQEDERRYMIENWYAGKKLAVYSSIFLILTWVFGIIFIRPNGNDGELMDQIWFWALAPVCNLPIPFMVARNWPRDRRKVYQTFLGISVWSWSIYTLIFIKACGFYEVENREHAAEQCQRKDFLSTFYYTSAIQVIGLFGLHLSRLTALLGASIWLIMACVLILPHREAWGRNLLNFVLFELFLLYVHWMAELSERRLYTLREQLQTQHRHTQKAQYNERKAWESRKRVTSYVRVPLNTALLAAQNMEAGMIIDKDHEIDFRALEGSLSVMSNVLNDVLDFNRMDSGRFESAPKPYALHSVMRSLFIPLGLVAKARDLDLVTDLDPQIDYVARRAALEAEGECPPDVLEQMRLFPEGDGMVLGDENRLRQIINNLASNAAKFTPAGGQIKVTTKLILPVSPFPTTDGVLSENVNDVGNHGLSMSRLSQHNLALEGPQKDLERIVVRIEITDTGTGLKPSDMENNNLFSAYNQTELGRQQGGKGTGLGLALVRNIVKLSGGRLGVKSVYGEGSTFWVEMPLGVGLAAKLPPTPYEMVVAEMREGSEAMGASERGLGSVRATTVTDTSSVASPSPVPVESSVTRSTSAINGLMDQGGRVELMLANHQYSTRQLGDMTSGLAVLEGTIHEEEIERPNPLEPLFGGSTAMSSDSTLKPQQRPTFVQLPSPDHRFSLEVSPSPGASAETPSSMNTGMGLLGCSVDMPTPSSESSRLSPRRVSIPADAPSLTVSGGAVAGSSAGSNGTSPGLPPPPFEGLEVLVVDDDTMTRRMMDRLLTRLGCKVVTAENGLLALELLAGSARIGGSPDASLLETGVSPYSGRSRFAVTFLDNQMPILSGLAAVARLRELRGQQDFVVGVTGNALLPDQEEYLDAGVNYILTKPVLEASLKSILVKADERRRVAP